MKVAEIYQKYPQKTWVLAEVTREDAQNKVMEVKPIFASTKRDEVYAKIAEVPTGTHVTTLYTGPILGEGKAFAFGVI